jgi:hypothetical protein
MKPMSPAREFRGQPCRNDLLLLAVKSHGIETTEADIPNPFPLAGLRHYLLKTSSSGQSFLSAFPSNH